VIFFTRPGMPLSMLCMSTGSIILSRNRRGGPLTVTPGNFLSCHFALWVFARNDLLASRGRRSPVVPGFACDIRRTLDWPFCISLMVGKDASSSANFAVSICAFFVYASFFFLIFGHVGTPRPSSMERAIEGGGPQLPDSRVPKLMVDSSEFTTLPAMFHVPIPWPHRRTAAGPGGR